MQRKGTFAKLCISYNVLTLCRYDYNIYVCAIKMHDTKIMKNQLDKCNIASYNKNARALKQNLGGYTMGNVYFSTRVKELREKAGLSMDQLAKVLGVTKSRVNMWENNGTLPRSEVLIQLANYFKVTTDYLLGNDDTSDVSVDNKKLNTLQRNLGKLNEEELSKAEGMLKIVFKDIFDDEEDEDDI